MSPQARFVLLDADTAVDATRAALLACLTVYEARLMQAPRDADGELVPIGRTATWLCEMKLLRRIARWEGMEVTR
jgi:hypothetical protein